jgi:hypothetical protein
LPAGARASITGKTSVAELENNPEAQASIDRFQKAFPNVPNAKLQIYDLVKGESGMGRDMVQRNQYAGYFALGRDEAYGQMGMTKQQFAALPFDRQMDAYTGWLKRNDPSGTNTKDLGLFNAASARKWQNMPDETVVYPAGSIEARSNAPTWGRASGAGGAVTIGGIKRYYSREGEATQREIAEAGVTTAPGAPATATAAAQPETRVASLTPSTTPGVTPNIIQYPGSENFYTQTGATSRAQPYSAIVAHVAGFQDVDKEAKWSGKSGYGYQYLVAKDGSIYQLGDPDKVRPNQIQGSKFRTSQFDVKNYNALGVGFITGGKEPTKAQMSAAGRLFPYLQEKYHLPRERVYGHGEIQGEDPERSHLGPGGTPEAQVIAAAYREGSLTQDVQTVQANARTRTAGAVPFVTAEGKPSATGPGRITGGAPLVSPDGKPPAATRVAALDTAKIDRAAAQKVDVNGAGKVSVDVAAAARKEDKGKEKLFKKTELSPQKSMESAKPTREAANAEE